MGGADRGRGVGGHGKVMQACDGGSVQVMRDTGSKAIIANAFFNCKYGWRILQLVEIIIVEKF